MSLIGLCIKMMVWNGRFFFRLLTETPAKKKGSNSVPLNTSLKEHLKKSGATFVLQAQSLPTWQKISEPSCKISRLGQRKSIWSQHIQPSFFSFLGWWDAIAGGVQPAAPPAPNVGLCEGSHAQWILTVKCCAANRELLKKRTSMDNWGVI